MELSHIFGYAGAVLTGLVLGLMGGGGALLSIPVLVYLFHIEVSTATGYSLFLIAVSASSGALQNVRKKLIDYQAAVYYGIPSVITIYLVRRFLIPKLPSTILTIGQYSLDKHHFILYTLCLVMFGVAYKMIASDNDSEAGDTKHPKHHLLMIFYAVLTGGFLGLVGAGGGFLIVPALIYFANAPAKKAVGTSLLLVAVNSFVGFLGDVSSNQNMDWKFLFVFSLFAISGVFIGNYISHFIKGSQLKKYFGWFVLLTGIYILLKETFFT